MRQDRITCAVHISESWIGEKREELQLPRISLFFHQAAIQQSMDDKGLPQTTGDNISGDRQKDSKKEREREKRKVSKLLYARLLIGLQSRTV